MATTPAFGPLLRGWRDRTDPGRVGAMLTARRSPGLKLRVAPSARCPSCWCENGP